MTFIFFKHCDYMFSNSSTSFFVCQKKNPQDSTTDNFHNKVLETIVNACERKSLHESITLPIDSSASNATCRVQDGVNSSRERSREHSPPVKCIQVWKYNNTKQDSKWELFIQRFVSFSDRSHSRLNYRRTLLKSISKVNRVLESAY